MADEHPLDRYVRAKSAISEQSDKVKELVESLYSAASRLQNNWPRVHFSGVLSSGNPVQPMTNESHLIIDLNAPSMEAIYEAIKGWRAADSELRGAIASMTQEQRQVLGLRQD